MRLFIAVPIPDHIRSTACRLIEPFRPLVKGSFVRPENLHATLAFLGDVPDRPRIDLIDAMDGLGLPAVSVTIDRIDAFRHRGTPSIIYIGGDDASLSSHADAVRTMAKHAGIDIDGKPFRLHVTLARIKAVKHAERFDDVMRLVNESFAPMRFLADAVELVKSELTPTGARYETVFKKALRVS